MTTTTTRDCWLCHADQATVEKPKMKYPDGTKVTVCKDCSGYIDSNPKQNDRVAQLRIKKICPMCQKPFFPKDSPSELFCGAECDNEHRQQWNEQLAKMRARMLKGERP